LWQTGTGVLGARRRIFTSIRVHDFDRFLLQLTFILLAVLLDKVLGIYRRKRYCCFGSVCVVDVSHQAHGLVLPQPFYRAVVLEVRAEHRQVRNVEYLYDVNGVAVVDRRAVN
jgi:hypothetical protein